MPGPSRVAADQDHLSGWRTGVGRGHVYLFKILSPTSVDRTTTPASSVDLRRRGMRMSEVAFQASSWRQERSCTGPLRG
jgi:hypothetical protein